VMTPESEVRKRGITFIAGEPPNLLNPPSGCRFHPRCPYAKPICKEVEPPIIEVRDDRIVACHLVESFM